MAAWSAPTCRVGQRAGRPVEAQPGRVQHLVGVDVAEAGDGLLVEQDALDRTGPVAQAGPEHRRRELVEERIRPSRASSGTSTSARDGSKTTTSPNVRGSTNHSSSAAGQRHGHVGVGWSGRAAERPGAAGRSCAGGPSPRRPCRAGPRGTCPGGRRRSSSCRSARRSRPPPRSAGPSVGDRPRPGRCDGRRRGPPAPGGRSRPRAAQASWRVGRRPAGPGAAPAAPALALAAGVPLPTPFGSSSVSTETSSTVLTRWSKASRAAACSACFFARPSPCPQIRPSTRPSAKKRLAWSGPSSRTLVDGRAVEAGGRPAPAGRSCSRGRRARSTVVGDAGGRAARSTKRVAGVGAAVEVDRADDGLERVGQDRRLLPAAGGVLALAQQEGRRRARARSATSASASAFTTALRRSVSLPSGRSA